MTPTRRRVLVWGGVVVGAGTAGCGSEDPPPGLVASNAQVIHRPDDNRFDYPEDVAVRVSVENSASERRDGVLQTTLELLEDQSGETPAVLESWTRETEVSVSRGTSQAVLVVFEDVLDGSEQGSLRARASI